MQDRTYWEGWGLFRDCYIIKSSVAAQSRRAHAALGHFGIFVPPRVPWPRPPRRPQAMQARCNDLGDMLSDVHGLGPAHSTSRGRPEHSKSPKCGRSFWACGGLAGTRRESWLPPKMPQAASMRQRKQHPRDNMGSIMHFIERLEMGSKSTIPVLRLWEGF